MQSRLFVHRLKEPASIGSDNLSIARSCFPPLGQTIVFNTMTVPIKPLRSHLRPKPVRSDFGQNIQSCSQGFSNRLQAVESPYRSQHMRRIGALMSTRFEPSTFLEQFEDPGQQPLFRMPGNEPRTKFTQHGEIKAWVGQFQTERIFPIDTATDRLSGLSVR